MKNVILLLEKDVSSETPIIDVRKAFADWDYATLCCAERNETAIKDTYFYLKEVPFEGEAFSEEYNIYHSGEEVFISYESDEIVAIVELEDDSYESIFNEEGNYTETYDLSVKTITIAGTDLSVLNLSKEFKQEIEHEAELYRDEVVQDYYDRRN